MKAEDLFDALGKIDDSLIDSVELGEVKKQKKSNIFKWAIAVAACVCLLITGNAVIDNYVENDLKLTKLDISSIVFGQMGLGLEGTDYLSESNSDNINPWTKDSVIETLPVFKNKLYNDGRLSQTYYSAEDLKKKAEDFAEALDLDIISGEAVEGKEINEIYCYILKTKQGQITVSGSGVSFTINIDCEYLLDKHLEYSYGSEAKRVSGVYKSYSIDSEYLSEKTISYFEKDSLEENILAFNLQGHYESRNEKYISSISDDCISSSYLYADYPVITWQEAQKKLLKGEYISAANESQVIGGKLTRDSISDVELIYYTQGNPEFYIPFYRFSVEYYSGDSENQQYVYFYVCAVNDAYIL